MWHNSPSHTQVCWMPPLQVSMQCPLLHWFLHMPELRNKHWYEAAYSKIPSIQGAKQIVTGFKEV